MELKKEDILPILIKALEIEKYRCNNFAVISKAYDNHYTISDSILNIYKVNRCKRLWYIIRWVDENVFPNEVEEAHKISYEEYKKQFISLNVCKREKEMDLLSIFEDKMLEEWEQKIKETQVMNLK